MCVHMYVVLPLSHINLFVVLLLFLLTPLGKKVIGRGFFVKVPLLITFSDGMGHQGWTLKDVGEYPKERRGDLIDLVTLYTYLDFIEC